MSENGEKCPSKFPKTQGDVFKIFFAFMILLYFIFSQQKTAEKKLEPVNIWYLPY